MFEISRRDLVLGSTGAALVFGLKGPVSFIGAAHAQRAADSLKYKVGDIEVFSLHEGSIERTVAEGMVKNAALDDVKRRSLPQASGLTRSTIPSPSPRSGPAARLSSSIPASAPTARPPSASSPTT